MHTPPLTSDTPLLTQDELLHRKGTVYHHLTYLLRQESTSPYLTYRALCTLYTTFPELALCRTPESECIWESLMSLIYDPEHEDYVRLSALTLMAKLLRKMERHNAKKNKEGKKEEGKQEEESSSDSDEYAQTPSPSTQTTYFPAPLSSSSVHTNPESTLPPLTSSFFTLPSSPRAHSSIDQPLPTPPLFYSCAHIPHANHVLNSTPHPQQRPHHPQ